MDFKEYSEKALRTAGIYDTVQDQVTNAALGLAGESGEVVDHIKKVLFQGHGLDRREVVLELGDIGWYINLMLDALGYTWEDMWKMNIDKLEKRYPTHEFRVEDSVNRVV